MRARISAFGGTIALELLGGWHEGWLWILSQVKISLIGRPGCHLCDDARAVISQVIGDGDIDFEEISLLDDPNLMAQYSEEIPVILINGLVHDFLRVDEDRLIAAIAIARSQ
jgi:hypothetical protein